MDMFNTKVIRTINGARHTIKRKIRRERLYNYDVVFYRDIWRDENGGLWANYRGRWRVVEPDANWGYFMDMTKEWGVEEF